MTPDSDPPISAPRRVVRGACPHDCPDTCALLVTVENGRAVVGSGSARSPADRRRALHEGRALPRAHLFVRARAAPDAPHRKEGPGRLRAHLVGRSARDDRGQVRGDRGVTGRAGSHRPVLVCGHDGASAIRLDGSPVLPSARRIAARPDDLRHGRQGRLGRDDRRRNGDRRRGVRAESPDPDLGQQPDRRPTSISGRARRRQSGAARSSSPSIPTGARRPRNATSIWRSCPGPMPRSRSGSCTC